jgi:hypothetical protein
MVSTAGPALHHTRRGGLASTATVLGIAAALVMGVVAIGAFVLLARSDDDHVATSSEDSETSPQSLAGQPTPPSTSATYNGYAQRYLDAVAVGNAAHTRFFDAEAIAKATPCECPRGSWNLELMVPAATETVPAFQQAIDNLTALAASAPAELQQQLQTMIAAATTRVKALQAFVTSIGDVTGPAPTETYQAFLQSYVPVTEAANRLRTTLGLPQLK